MSRLTQKQYQRHAMLASAAYIAAMLLVWPLARTAVGLPLKVVLAMLPLLPMFYLIGLLAWRIRDSDELEQRMHLVALGVTGAVVAASSMVGGFLAAAKIVPLDGSILIMVFPLMASCYGVTRWWVARRYGVSVTCDDAGSVPVYLRFLLMALVMGLVALFAHYRQNDEGMGTALGVAAVFAVAGVVFGVRRWLSSRQGVSDDK
jgi:hypothetical protein